MNEKTLEDYCDDNDWAGDDHAESIFCYNVRNSKGEIVGYTATEVARDIIEQELQEKEKMSNK